MEPGQVILVSITALRRTGHFSTRPSRTLGALRKYSLHLDMLVRLDTLALPQRERPNGEAGPPDDAHDGKVHAARRTIGHLS